MKVPPETVQEFLCSNNARHYARLQNRKNPQKSIVPTVIDEIEITAKDKNAISGIYGQLSEDSAGSEEGSASTGLQKAAYDVRHWKDSGVDDPA
jgi:hypothetical protein